MIVIELEDGHDMPNNIECREKLFVDDLVSSHHDWALLYPTYYMGTLGDDLLMNACLFFLAKRNLRN